MVKISKPLVQDGLVCQDGLDETDVFAWRVCECGGLMIRLQGNTAMCSEWPNCNRTCNLEALMCDKESAELRKLAHSILDKGWKTKNERNRMYDNLKEYAGKDIHFGKMSKSELKEIIPKLKSFEVWAQRNPKTKESQ